MESTDKAGAAVIGWLWMENNVNLSVALVEEGLASLHFTAEKSEHYRALKFAEDQAKSKKKGIWANWVEPAFVEEVCETTFYLFCSKVKILTILLVALNLQMPRIYLLDSQLY